MEDDLASESELAAKIAPKYNYGELYNVCGPVH